MKLLRLLSMTALILAFGIGTMSCNNVTDEQIQNEAQERLNANPELSGVLVTVANKEATLYGTVEDESEKSLAESTVAGIENVNSVINQIEVIPPAPDFTGIDNAINAGLAKVVEAYKTVSAEVHNGIVTVKGEIRKRDHAALLDSIRALSPVEVIDSVTVK